MVLGVTTLKTVQRGLEKITTVTKSVVGCNRHLIKFAKLGIYA